MMIKTVSRDLIDTGLFSLNEAIRLNVYRNAVEAGFFSEWAVIIGKTQSQIRALSIWESNHMAQERRFNRL